MCPSPTIQLTLWSASQKPYVVANTTLGAVVYQVSWDQVFNGLNYKYRKATVRAHLSGTTNIAKDDVADATGYLTLIGLGSGYAYSLDAQGVIIGDLQYSNSSQVSSAETGYYINTDTRDNVAAPMIAPPQGVMGNFTVGLVQESGALMANANLSNYTLTLIFELFDEI